jgi:hypothetical protein
MNNNFFDKESLTEGLKNIYYTPSAAVADIIDNALSAGAQNIDINFWNGEEAYIAIVDDGHGMTHEEMLNALKIKKNINTNTDKFPDLGKFGWGLKTASFSQCNFLIIISKKNKTISHVCMDSNFNIHNKTRTELYLKFKTIQNLFENRVNNSGTAIIWTDLNDDISGKNIIKNNINSAAFYSVGQEVADYAALHFHNFLDNKNIYFNTKPIIKWNPFFECDGLQKYEKRIVKIKDQLIEISGYLYPKEDDFEDLELYQELGGTKGWFHSQGIYIYREDRLLDYGGWFGLSIGGSSNSWQLEEKYKRCRLSIKYNRELDEYFSPTVQKNKSDIPHFLRHELLKYCDQIRKDSIKRTNKILTSEIYNIDEIIQKDILITDPNNSKAYILDKEHPLIKEFSEKNLGKIKRDFFIEKLSSDLKKINSKKISIFKKIFGDE